MSDKNACSLPPELSDDDLNAFLRGAADARIAQHLEACAYCRERLEDERLANLLSVKLSRFTCPESQMLTDYVMDMLPAPDRPLIKKHLETCAACQEEINTLRQFLQDNIAADATLPVTIPGVRKNPAANYYVAQIQPIGEVRNSLRGKAYGPILAHISDDLNIFIEYKESVNAGTLTGQIAATRLETWQSSLVQIFRDLKAIATITVNELGGFQCEVPHVHQIDIRIVAPTGETISIPDLTFEDDD